jgi:quercetin dioxygenase-like cupin family protein
MGKNVSTISDASCHVPERELDGALLTFDLKDIIENMKQEPAWKTGERNTMTLMKNPDMTIMLIALHSGARFNSREADKVASGQLIEGSATFQTNSESLSLKPGMLLTFHEKAGHTFVALEDSVLLVTIVQNKKSAPAANSTV